MARGKTLQELLVSLKKEIGYVASPAVGDSVEPALIELLQRTQENLYEDHDWSFLLGHHYKTINAGQNKYDFPKTINLDHINWCRVLFDSQWVGVDYGITLDEYNIYNPLNDERADPIQRWIIADDDQFEVWPMPSQATTVCFYGKQALKPMFDLNDRATLDDRLIVLFSASEWLSGDKTKQDRARSKLGYAQQRLAKLKGNLSKNRVTDLTGRSTQPKEKEIRVAYVR